VKPTEEYKFSFWVIPMAKEDDPATVASRASPKAADSLQMFNFEKESLLDFLLQEKVVKTDAP